MSPTGTLTVIGAAALASIAASTGPELHPSSEVQSELACILMRTDRLPPESRRSPIDSVSFNVDGHPVKICYGRPSARGRTMIGGRLPYGKLWRTGANEPTMIHSSIPLEIAGLSMPAGTYSLYTVPGEGEWQIILNRSIEQWGAERYYSPEVEAQEIGRATVSSGATEEHIEMFTIRSAEGDDENAVVVLEWERTRVTIPVSAGE